jgi:hypothetical protein
MIESTALVHDWIATAPRKKAGAFAALATDRQVKAYWARVRSGDIDHREGVGYVRTGSSKRWTHNVKTVSNGIRGEVGNNSPSLIWAQSEQHQQPFHKASGWRTVEDAIEENSDKIADKFERVIKKVVK